jgi:hypothetical protein
MALCIIVTLRIKASLKTGARGNLHNIATGLLGNPFGCNLETGGKRHVQGGEVGRRGATEVSVKDNHGFSVVINATLELGRPRL